MSNSKFTKPYGRQIMGSNSFSPNMDTTDQRVQLNDPQELYNRFVIPENMMDELENENIDDFDNDFYDYDDRTDYGVDIALASQLDLPLSASRKRKVK